MINISVDEKKIEALYMQEIKKRLDLLDNKTLFWDRKELLKQTRMSWSTIQEQFFFHPDFPKQKVGAKWYFPARKAEFFLLNWLEENPKYQNWKDRKEA
ncbi:group-specific protein [Bacillaceae bacterium IKA-2]|nr:group-specific protein [Bacillaceae bacterium IKA-2]